MKTNLHRFNSTLKDYILLQKRCSILFSTPHILLFLLINVSMSNSWRMHVFHQWGTAGEPMSFTNMSMGNSWGMHVFHKCVNGKQLGNTCLSHRYNGEQLGNACLSQMCQWGTHVFHK